MSTVWGLPCGEGLLIENFLLLAGKARGNQEQI